MTMTYLPLSSASSSTITPPPPQTPAIHPLQSGRSQNLLIWVEWDFFFEAEWKSLWLVRWRFLRFGAKTFEGVGWRFLDSLMDFFFFFLRGRWGWVVLNY